MSDQRPTKRPRDDLEQDAAGCSHHTQLAIKKSRDLWLHDGNIILVCESTGFRVHQSVLELHSQVFKDMLAVGSPDDDKFEDCTVVTLPDAADDILHVLKALYFRDSYATEERLDLQVLASLLRMATKYMFSSIRKEIIPRLQILFPDTYETYVSLERFNRTPIAKLDPEVGIELGLTCGVPIIIPAALYMCVLRMFIGGKSRLMSPLGDTASSSQAAQIRCLRFMNNWSDLMDDVFSDLEGEAPWETLELGYWKCLDPEHRSTCIGLPLEAKREMETRCRRLTTNILKRDIVPMDMLEEYGVCASCRAGVLAYQGEVRRKIWDVLPEAAGYSDWDALRTEQRRKDARRETS